jgi:hypothetical protein
MSLHRFKRLWYVIAGFGIRSVGTLSFVSELENATGPIPLTKRTK